MLPEAVSDQVHNTGCEDRQVARLSGLFGFAGRPYTLPQSNNAAGRSAVPIVDRGEPMFPPYLPGNYYVRVSFEGGGDQRGFPFYKPLPEQDHLKAYRHFLHASKEEAIEAFILELGNHVKIDPGVPPGPLDEPPPLGEGNEYICKCRVQEDGEVDCVRRVAHLDVDDGIVTLMNWDEDFLISWTRHYVFETHDIVDPCTLKASM
jgi:hypothetical protein